MRYQRSQIRRIARRILALGVLSAAVVATVCLVVNIAFATSVSSTEELDEPAPGVSVEASAPQHVASGSDFVINVAYQNAGLISAPDTWLTMTIPAGAQFITATDRLGVPQPASFVEATSAAWNLGTLPPDSCCGHILVRLRVDADMTEGALLTTNVSIATSAPDANLSNNAATITSTVCDMAGSTFQTHQGEAKPGDVVTHTLMLSLAHRAGMGTVLRQMVVTVSLPVSHQVRFLGWTGQVTGTIHDGQVLRWQGQMRAGEPVTLQYRIGVEGVVTPGANMSAMAQLSWGMGEMQLGPVTTVVTMPHGVIGLGPNQAAELRHEYGITLAVPPGAVTDTTRFEFRPLYTHTNVISGPLGLIYAHRAFELTAFRFGEQVRQFNRPLTLTLAYSDTDVSGLRQETLRLWTRQGPGEPWTMLGEPVRAMSGTLAVTTTHFTEFALFAEGIYRIFVPQLAR